MQAWAQARVWVRGRGSFKVAICMVFTGTTDAVIRGGESTVWDGPRAKVCEKGSQESVRGMVDTGISISSSSEETSISAWDCHI